ncbi:hypothetical protein FRC11_010535, partial [Ceratobasidium sp. 423]
MADNQNRVGEGAIAQATGGAPDGAVGANLVNMAANGAVPGGVVVNPPIDNVDPE